LILVKTSSSQGFAWETSLTEEGNQVIPETLTCGLLELRQELFENSQ